MFREGSMPVGTSSFERLSEEELEAHLGVARYGNFKLTEAIRPSYDLQVVPDAGLSPRRLPRRAVADQRARADGAPSRPSGCSRPSWTCSTRWAGWSTWCWRRAIPATPTGHADLYREHIDSPVLKSILWEYEDLLVNDGCTGIAVLNPGQPLEVQFDEHKLLIVYGNQLGDFEDDLPRAGHPLRREAEVHHRGRARPLFQRPLRPAIRRAEDAAGHGRRVRGLLSGRSKREQPAKGPVKPFSGKRPTIVPS